MHDTKLPPRAAALRDAVVRSACDARSARDLRALLGLPVAPPPAKAAAARPRAKTLACTEGALDAGARARLATDVVNAALQSLTRAVKARAAAAQPLQPRSPNAKTQSDGDLAALAECAGAALAALRTAQGGDQALRLAQGACSLAAKLAALGLHEAAAREAAAAVAHMQGGKGGLEAAVLVLRVPGGVAERELLAQAQVQAVKTAARVSGARLAVLDALLGDKKTVVQLVEHDLPEGAKRAKFLEQLAQAVRALADGLAADGPGRVSALASKLLELRLRCRAWDAAAQPDAQRQLAEPLAASMGALTRAPLTKNECARARIAILAFLDFLTTRPAPDLAPVASMRAAARRGLAHLAREEGDGAAALRWLHDALRDGPALPTCAQSALRCHLASYSLHFGAEDLPAAVGGACDALAARLQGSPADLDELLVAASAARKQATAHLLGAEPATARAPCKRLLLGLPRFLRRVLDHLCQPEPDPSRLRLVAQVARPAIDAAALLGKAALADAEDDDRDLVAAVAEGAALATALEARSVLPQADRSAFVTLSNALWARYLHRRRGDARPADLHALLAQAAKVLEPRPLAERRAGFVAVKHEKLAAVLEVLNDGPAAVEQFKKALLAKADLGELEEAPPTTGASSAADLMEACLRARAKVCASRRTALTPLAFEADEATAARLAELQLRVAVQSMQSESPVAGRDFFTDLYRTLRRHYEQSGSTTARAGLELAVLHGACIDPDAFPSDVVVELMGRQAEGSSLPERHVREQHAVYRILLGGEELAGMGPILTRWQTLAHSDTLDQVLQSIDTAAWMSQLKLVEATLQLHGNADLHATCLQVLLGVYKSAAASDPAAVVTYTSALADQLVRCGRPAAAGRHLLGARQHLEQHAEPWKPAVLWHSAHASYQLALGNLDKAEASLARVRTELQSAGSGWRPTRHELAACSSRWLHQHSQLATARGQHGLALYCARKSSKLAYRAWALFEKLRGRPADDAVTADPCVSTRHDSLRTAACWALVPALFEHTVQLVAALADAGLVLETQYYIDQAAKVAAAARSSRYLVQIGVVAADVDVRRGDAAKALAALQPLAATCKGLTLAEQAGFQLALAKAHHAVKDYGAEAQVLKAMEALLKQAEKNYDAGGDGDVKELQEAMKGLAVAPQAASKTAAQRAAPRTRKAPAATKARAEPPKQAQAASPGSDEAAVARAQADRLRQSCLLSLALGDWELAASLLETAGKPAPGPDTLSHMICQAGIFLSQGTSGLAKDPVFSLLEESAIMLPSKLQLAATDDAEEVQEPVKSNAKAKTTRARKTAAPAPKEAVEPKGPQSSSSLQLCNNALIQSCGAVHVGSSTILNHRFSDLLARTQLLLSVTSASVKSIQYSPLMASWAFELGRSVAYSREQASIAAERLLEADREQGGDLMHSLPSIPSPQIDPARFQEEFIDAIPDTWTVVSIGLSDDTNELRISRLRSQRQPLTLTIPLDRHNPRDCDEEAFGFGEGKAELQEIIGLANFSAHDAGDLTKKGARTAWWEARAALDARLKDLMLNIENMWLGGFRGLLSQHVADRHLLSRFQQSLSNILQKHLPSRRKAGRGSKQPQVALDPQVLELFVGLGDPSQHPDLDETLMDLFYFIVDILQFNGERNAYDEIDFDLMIVDTMEALTQYHNAAAQLDTAGAPHHTVLILDKALHSFPWESMPFVDGHAMTRMPSLLSLKERLTMLKGQMEQSKRPQSTIEVNAEDGAYVLNPSSDLASTHKTFKQPLSALTSWDLTVNSLPSEAEITTYLGEKSIYLYLGHGSGGQYIRSRTIRRLPRCAVSLLMGCSSAIMTEAGKLESHGVPLTYLHAGAPAVVGTLWDVTDKDIDRYSLTVLERWGLIGSKAASDAKKARKGKVKVKGDESPVPEEHGAPVSLDKAVAEARGSCILRYLNGAAPVVYGVPVTLA